MFIAYRGRRRTYRKGRFRAGVMITVLSLTVLLLVSCVAGSNVLWVRGVLGLDIGDYAAEPTRQVLDVDSATVATLCDTVRVLLGNSVHLQEFRGTSQAVKLYRDVILNHMLRTGYASYTATGEALQEVKAQYPTLSVTNLISTSDFENTVCRYFGGTGASHKNGERFRYLDRADYYTSPAPAYACSVELEVLLAEETANTYRMEFRLSSGSERSDVYRAIFVKRADAAPYWKLLEKI